MGRPLGRVRDVVWEDFDGEAVVVHATRNGVWRLNRTATWVWKHCNGESSLDDLARHLAQSAGVEVGRVIEDLDAFCAELRGQGLLQTAPCAALNGGQAQRNLTTFRFRYVPPALFRIGAKSPKKPSPLGTSTP